MRASCAVAVALFPENSEVPGNRLSPPAQVMNQRNNFSRSDNTGSGFYFSTSLRCGHPEVRDRREISATIDHLK